MWAYSPQIAEIGNSWYKFAKKTYTPLSDFHKIWVGEGLPGLHPHAKFYRCGFKIWTYSHQNHKKSVIFAPMGYIPLSNFYKIWRGGATPTYPNAR